jgi:hypothetical protein
LESLEVNWSSLLLDLFGARVDQAESVHGAEFALRHGTWLGAAILAALALGALAWWSYRRETADLTTSRQRTALVALRIAFWLLLLIVLLRPVIVFSLETTVRRTLILLIDTSASMTIEDPRYDDADRKRAAIAMGALDARDGLDQKLPDKAVKPISRRDLLMHLFSNDVLKLEDRFRRDCDLSVFTFGQIATDVGSRADLSGWVRSVDFNDKVTALGDAIREILQRKRGQSLAGIVVFSDGASNTGSSPVDAAREAAREKVPLLTVGFGVTSPRDVVLAGILAQDTAFVNDELPVTVRVRAQGLQGQSATLTLRLAGEIVGTKEVQFTNEVEQTVPLPFTPKQTGEFELQATIEPRPDEAVKDNNTTTQRLRVVDARVKVLYVEATARWEFRYIQSAMLRDRRLDSKYLLLEGDASIAEGAGSPYLAKFPQSKEELFKYDLLMLGDVTPSDVGAERLGWIEEFVSKLGGSCLLLAGPRANPPAWNGTPIEKLLPVELAVPGLGTTPGSERGTAFELTPQGRTHPLLQLGAGPDENAATWAKFGRIFWVARVGRAKAGAQVLLADNDPTKATRAGKMPVIAVQQYGLGQVLYVGTDNTWRWRKNLNEPLHAQLWVQMIQKLGMQRVLGGSRRTQLSTDRQGYTVGERISVFARLYQSDFTPVRAPQVDASIVIQGRETRQALTLRPVTDQPGMYRSEFLPLVPGIHEVKVSTDSDAMLEIPVSEPRYELGATAMNEPLLRQLAELTSGAFFREENIVSLPDAVRSKTETIQTTVDAEVWASPLVFILLVTLPTIEWALRKRWQLK